MAFLNATNMRAMWPRAPQRKIDAIVSAAPKVFAEFGLNTRGRIAHLMAQISHENGAGTIIRENMNYSAERMVQIFGVGVHSAAVTYEEAQRLAHRPEQIAERVYGLGNPRKAKELGNTRLGDGWRFRGNGDLQLTGGGSHREIGAKIGVDLYGHPEQLEDPATSFRCAVAEFVALNCLPAADADNVNLVTRRVNGGLNGLSERKVWLAKWKRVLADEVGEDDVVAIPAVPPPAEPRGGESDQAMVPAKSRTLKSVLVGLATGAGSIGAVLSDWKVAAVLGVFVMAGLFLFVGRERIAKIIEQGI